MKEIILNSIKDFACGNTGSCQINLQSESAQEMLADKIVKNLEPYVREEMGRLIENVVCGGSFHGDE
jgi:hypothetical protein